MTFGEFMNRVRSLHCIDGDDLGGLPKDRTAVFLENPVRFLMKCDDATAAMIWNAIEARQRPPAVRAA
jgi:hypothetical protein